MKTLLTILFLLATMVMTAHPALAMCTTNTIFTPDGRTVICQVCCYGGSCTTTCF